MKTTNTIAFFLGWNNVEKKYVEDISIELSSLKYLVEKGKLSANDFEDLPASMKGEAIIRPEGIANGKVTVCVFIQNLERKNIEFSFEVEGEEVEVVDEKLVVVVI